MRNITAFAVLVIIGFFNSPPSAAQEHAYVFSLTPQFGIVYGQAEEIVYSSQKMTKFLSQLLWDMKPVLYYGLVMDLSRSEQREKWGFFSSLSLKNGIPGITGYMEDRDWQSTANADLTDYSRHDNHTRELFFLDFSAGLSFPFVNALVFKPYINVSFMRFSFWGQDGYGEYEITSDPRYEDFTGMKVISYTQEWLTISPGVSLVYCFFPGFSASLSFMASPVVFCADLDEHKKREYPYPAQFRDYMMGGMLFEPGFCLSYMINKQIAATMDFSWRYISGTKGYTYYRMRIGEGNYMQSGTAGAGLSIINASLGLNVRL